MFHFNARQFNITLINIPGDVNLWVRVANETHWSTKDNGERTQVRNFLGASGPHANVYTHANKKRGGGGEKVPVTFLMIKKKYIEIFTDVIMF